MYLLKFFYCAGFFYGTMVTVSFGSSFNVVSLQERIKASDLILEGSPVKQEVEVSQETGRVSTLYYIELASVLKGTYDARVAVLRYPGGVVGDRVMKAVGVASPTLNEPALFFLQASAADAAEDQKVYLPVGLHLGVWKIASREGVLSVWDPYTRETKLLDEVKNTILTLSSQGDIHHALAVKPVKYAGIKKLLMKSSAASDSNALDYNALLMYGIFGAFVVVLAFLGWAIRYWR